MFINGTPIIDDTPTSDELAAIMNAPCLERAEAEFVAMQIEESVFVDRLCESARFINGEFYNLFTRAIVFGHPDWLFDLRATQKRHEILLQQVRANFKNRVNGSYHAISRYVTNDSFLSEHRKSEILDSLWFRQHKVIELIESESAKVIEQYRQTLNLLKSMAWRSMRRHTHWTMFSFKTPFNERVAFLERIEIDIRRRQQHQPTSFHECFDAPVVLARYRKRHKSTRVAHTSA